MTKFFFKLKKPYFWPISLIWRQKVFLKNWAVMHNFRRVSSTMPTLREIWWFKSKKTPTDVKRVGWNDPISYDPAIYRGLTSTIAVDWCLKVKDIEYDAGLTKNYYIPVSMQKISSIHKHIQLIWGPHVLNSHAYFWPCPTKNHWNHLAFLNFQQHTKRSFHQFII